MSHKINTLPESLFTHEWSETKGSLKDKTYRMVVTLSLIFPRTGMA